MRSFDSLLTLSTAESPFSSPLTTWKTQSLPENGSTMVLSTMAENGADGLGGRSTGSPVLGSSPIAGARSAGDGV
jgi:hypothetical protein